MDAPPVEPVVVTTPAPFVVDARLVVEKRVAPMMPTGLAETMVGYWTCPVRMWVEPTGVVARVERARCDERVRAAAEAAARQWRFARVQTEEKELPYEALFVFRVRRGYDPKDDLRVDVEAFGELAPWSRGDGGFNFGRSMVGAAVGISSTHTASMLLAAENGEAWLLGTEGRLRLNSDFSPYVGARTTITQSFGTAVPTVDNSLQVGLDVRPLGIWGAHLGVGPTVILDLEDAGNLDPTEHPPLRLGVMAVAGLRIGVPLHPAPTR